MYRTAPVRHSTLVRASITFVEDEESRREACLERNAAKPKRAQNGKTPHRLATMRGLNSAPDWIRTSGLILRRDALYPAELRARVVL